MNFIQCILTMFLLKYTSQVCAISFLFSLLCFSLCFSPIDFNNSQCTIGMISSTGVFNYLYTCSQRKLTVRLSFFQKPLTVHKFSIRVRAPKPTLTPCWHVDWLDLDQATTAAMSSSLQCPVKSRKHSFISVFPNF